ncbi:MAG: FtsH protease activity modulator HflK [Neomegalonema sp.]|nr:FtsH protease activity modulator HflK [Neomegalonema sp.]
MPWSNDGGGSNSPGPWGGGGRGSGGGGKRPGGPWGGGGGGNNGGGQPPNIDDFFKKGQDQLKNVLGDGNRGGGFGGLLLIALVAAGAWAYASVFRVEDQEQGVVLTFGEYSHTVGPGLNFAPWPVQTAVVRAVTRENVVNIGLQQSSARSNANNDGLMLTGDENIVDINFQVAWTIKELDKFLFNLAESDRRNQDETIRAVAESAIREVVARSRLAPLLNTDRATVAAQVKDLIQATLDEYNAGVNIRRVTLDRVDPPPEVLDDFRAVQAAEQERDQLQQEAQRDANQKLAAARGESRTLLEQAEAYRSQVIAEAEGEAARFTSVLSEYESAKDVTRRRLYIETMEKVLGGMDKVIIDQNGTGASGQGVVPYLPLDQLRRNSARAN